MDPLCRSSIMHDNDYHPRPIGNIQRGNDHRGMDNCRAVFDTMCGLPSTAGCDSVCLRWPETSSSICVRWPENSSRVSCNTGHICGALAIVLHVDIFLECGSSILCLSFLRLACTSFLSRAHIVYIEFCIVYSVISILKILLIHYYMSLISGIIPTQPVSYCHAKQWPAPPSKVDDIQTPLTSRDSVTFCQIEHICKEL